MTIAIVFFIALCGCASYRPYEGYYTYRYGEYFDDFPYNSFYFHYADSRPYSFYYPYNEYPPYAYSFQPEGSPVKKDQSVGNGNGSAE